MKNSEQKAEETLSIPNIGNIMLAAAAFSSADLSNILSSFYDYVFIEEMPKEETIEKFLSSHLVSQH